MIIKSTLLTPALKVWLQHAHDDDQPLEVTQCGPDILVERAGRNHNAADHELSDSEVTEVAAIMAAHSVEPLSMPQLACSCGQRHDDD